MLASSGKRACWEPGVSIQLTPSREVRSVNRRVHLSATGLVWGQSNKGECCHAVTGRQGFIINWGLILISHL